MTAYRGGQDVEGGLYLNHSTWRFESIPREGGILSGDNNMTYSHVPSPVLMVAGPLTGLAYIIVSPTLFCLSIGYLLARWVGWRLKMTKHLS